jgi:SrtB family sortase
MSEHSKTKKKKSFRESFIPSKSDSTGTLISKLIVLVSGVSLLVCFYFIGQHFWLIYEANQLNDDLADIYGEGVHIIGGGITTTAPPPAEGLLDDEGQPAVTTAWVEPPIMESAKQMLEINPDYQGYINFLGNTISEVVVKYSDNDYYLNHNFYGKKRSAGTVFADYRNVINGAKVSDNIVLYGHNNKDGTMFGEMDQFKYDWTRVMRNQFVYFDNYYTQDVYVIIAQFVTNSEPKHDDGKIFDYQNYINFVSSGQYTFENFKNEINKRTQFYTGIDFDENDKYITMSTCGYEFDEARFVMVARKLRPGETTESFDASKYVKNDNPYYPAIYIKYMG